MQYLKEDIQEKILHIAEEVFSEKGYKDASMREIASRSGITVSNIYHYFTNKDEIFRTILKPVLNELYAKIYSHDANQMTIDVFISSDFQQASVQEYIDLVSGHRIRLRMLLFQAQGSSLENFRAEYTDAMTRTIFCLFPGNEAEVSTFEYRYHRFLYSSQYGVAVCFARRTGAAPREERRNAEIYSRIYSL